MAATPIRRRAVYRAGGMLSGALAGLLLASTARGVPPLISGDVPTAENQGFELYTGFVYETEDNSFRRSSPAVELNYGVSDRQEVTIQVARLAQDRQQGWSDVVIGTKYVFLEETKSRPGIAGSLEWKLPVASVSRQLGTGAFDEDLLLRVQKTWGWFTALGNVGYTFLGEPKTNELNLRTGSWFVSFVGQYEIAEKTKLFTEIFVETNEERGGPARLAANLGFERELWHDVQFQAAVAKSLRGEGEGGPDLRVYAGFHWVFDAPWKRSGSREAK